MYVYYTSQTLFSSSFRYPAADHPEFALPESIPLFCLPSGVPVECWEKHTPFPLPTFSTFALTNAQGQCVSDEGGERGRERGREGVREREREKRKRCTCAILPYNQKFSPGENFHLFCNPLLSWANFYPANFCSMLMIMGENFIQ